MTEIQSSTQNVFGALAARVKELDGLQTKVGWFESAQYEDGTPVAYVAAINELGSPRNSIPARPFMRPTAIEQDQAWKETAAKAGARVLDGKMSGFDAMELLGLQAQGDIAKKIASITAPPLSPITLLARAWRQQGKTVTGKTIGEFASMLKNQRYDVISSIIAGVSTKPLNDTGHMIATLTHITEKA